MKARTRTALGTLFLGACAVGAVAYAYLGVEKKGEEEKLHSRLRMNYTVRERFEGDGITYRRSAPPSS